VAARSVLPTLTPQEDINKHSSEVILDEDAEERFVENRKWTKTEKVGLISRSMSAFIGLCAFYSSPKTLGTASSPRDHVLASDWIRTAND
jgi:hypothetical protein